MLSLVLLLLTADTLFETAPLDLDSPQGWLSTAIAQAPFALAGAVVSVILMAATFIVTSLAVNDAGGPSVRKTRRWATLVLAVSAACYVAWTVGSLWIPRNGTASGDAQFLGLSVAPVVISTMCALIALSSLTWAYPRRMPWSTVALVGSLVLGGVTALYLQWDDPNEVLLWICFIGTFLLAVVALVLGYFHRGAEKEHRRLLGWHGNGAAVAMLVALFASTVITSLLVIGAHAWLSTSNEAPTTEDRIWRLLPKATTNPVNPPDFYVQFAVLLLAILALLLGLAVIVAVAAFSRMPRLTVPKLKNPTRADPRRERADRNRGGTDNPRGLYPVWEKNLADKERVAASARRMAGVAHRGEKVMAALAILTAVALAILTAAALVPPMTALAPQDAPPGTKVTLAEWLLAQDLWRAIASAAGWALGLFAIAAVAWVVTNAVTSTERPLGLLWDVICFFPRAAHPFTPPCYAERTVPELEERLEEWFAGDDRDKRKKGVILSAHSMGAPIVVAVVFSIAAERRARSDRDRVPLGRIALLTYCVQLRAYFGRFFPAVFGPEAFGTPGTYAPSLVRRDPWATQVKREWPAGWLRGRTPWRRSMAKPAPTLPASTGMTLVELLGGNLHDGRAPRWRNLWRRTDYLGFPANSYRSADNLIDRGATERVPRPYLWTVARHNDYLATLQYVEARDELLAALKRPLRSPRTYRASATRAGANPASAAQRGRLT